MTDEHKEMKKRERQRGKSLFFYKVLHLGASDENLAYESQGVQLSGPAEDLKRIKALDVHIGKLTAKFNGKSRVPDDILADIQKHVSDLKVAFKRVVATREVRPDENDIEDTFGALGKSLNELFTGKKEKPERAKVYSLKYINSFTNKFDNKIDQEVARVSLY